MYLHRSKTQPLTRALVGVVLALLVASSGCRRRGPELHPATDQAGEGSAIELTYPSSFGRGFEILAKRAAAAVVQLSADAPVRNGPADWLSNAVGPLTSAPTPDGEIDPIERALGSGVLVDSQGHVLTNSHIVGNRERVWARLAGHRVIADVVGRDPVADIALVRMPSLAVEGVAPMRMGDSDGLRVGQWLLALADPFGLGPHASAGVVSALPTSPVPMASHRIWALLHTDLRIHAGNSGGAVLDATGHLVGIATAMGASAQDIGFVVPINIARRSLESLKRSGVVHRSWAGMVVRPVTKQDAEQAGWDGPKGGLVRAVIRGGPADGAGLRTGDIILAFDGKEITEARDLPWLVASAGIGKTVSVDLWRDGKRQSVSLQLQAPPQ